MKKNLLLLLCLVMAFQFIVVLFSGLVEHHSLPSVHGLMGMAIMTCVGIHLYFHRSWIRSALIGFNRLPETPRKNLSLDVLLFLNYGICGITGFAASGFPTHQLAHLHLLAAVSAIILQSIHLVRHRRWITSVARNLFSQANLA